jgi:hypothetical protein
MAFIGIDSDKRHNRHYPGLERHAVTPSSAYLLSPAQRITESP